MSFLILSRQKYFVVVGDTYFMGLVHGHVIWLTTEISQENYGAEADFLWQVSWLCHFLFLTNA